MEYDFGLSLCLFQFNTIRSSFVVLLFSFIHLFVYLFARCHIEFIFFKKSHAIYHEDEFALVCAVVCLLNVGKCFDGNKMYT